MTALAKSNFEIVQGDKFSVVFNLKDGNNTAFNLTGYSVAFQLRSASGSVLATLTNDDGLIITAATGKIELTLASSKTSTFPFGVHQYQLQLTINGDITTILGGQLSIIKDQCQT